MIQGKLAELYVDLTAKDRIAPAIAETRGRIATFQADLARSGSGVWGAQMQTFIRGQREATIMQEKLRAESLRAMTIDVRTVGGQKQIKEMVAAQKEAAAEQARFSRAFDVAAMGGFGVFMRDMKDSFEKFGKGIESIGNKFPLAMAGMTGLVAAASPDVFQTFTMSLQYLAASIGTMLLPMFIDFAIWLQRAARWVLSLDDETKKNIATYIGWGTAILAGAFALSRLIAVGGMVFGVFGGLWKMLAGIPGLLRGIGVAASWLMAHPVIAMLGLLAAVGTIAGGFAVTSILSGDTAATPVPASEREAVRMRSEERVRGGRPSDLSSEEFGSLTLAERERIRGMSHAERRSFGAERATTYRDVLSRRGPGTEDERRDRMEAALRRTMESGRFGHGEGTRAAIAEFTGLDRSRDSHRRLIETIRGGGGVLTPERITEIMGRATRTVERTEARASMFGAMAGGAGIPGRPAADPSDRSGLLPAAVDSIRGMMGMPPGGARPAPGGSPGAPAERSGPASPMLVRLLSAGREPRPREDGPEFMHGANFNAQFRSIEDQWKQIQLAGAGQSPLEAEMRRLQQEQLARLIDITKHTAIIAARRPGMAP